MRGYGVILRDFQIIEGLNPVMSYGLETIAIGGGNFEWWPHLIEKDMVAMLVTHESIHAVIHKLMGKAASHLFNNVGFHVMNKHRDYRRLSQSELTDLMRFNDPMTWFDDS